VDEEVKWPENGESYLAFSVVRCNLYSLGEGAFCSEHKAAYCDNRF
jgi:hypothetical protein